MTDIIVPSLGESVVEALVARWLKPVGASMVIDEPVVELETDKATLEVGAPVAGVLTSITVAEGKVVAVGAILGTIAKSTLATIEPNAHSSLSLSTSDKGKKEVRDTASIPPPTSPSVRAVLLDHGLQVADIPASGPLGRLTKEDVMNFVAGQRPAHELVGTHPLDTDAITPKEPRSTERVPMTRLRQTIARRLKEAQNTAAILTTFNDVDMSAVMNLRNTYKDQFEKRHGARLGFLSFFVKATIRALRDFPCVNAHMEDTDIVYKNYYDLGVAVSTPQGLVVPVLRDADTLTMATIERTIADLSIRAREGKLSMEHMSGGTFTITNGGVFGSLLSTPILNPPQSGILGLHRIDQRAVVHPDGSIIAKPMMYVALSYDHRIIDGRDAVGFLTSVKEAIEDPHRLLLEI